MVDEINEVTGQQMVDPGTRQKVGQSENADVVLEQIEGFKRRLDQGHQGSQGAGPRTPTRRFWPRVQAVLKEKARRMEHMKRGDELPSGVLEMVKVYVATKRQLSRRRQDGRPSREQGRHRPHRAGRRHAVPRRRHAGRHPAQPAGRAVAA